MPPDGSPKGPVSVDYLQQGGIPGTGNVTVKAVHSTFGAKTVSLVVQPPDATGHLPISAYQPKDALLAGSRL